MYNQNSPQSVEKYSSATTLSDMEVFIFPELLYALVLANIMSPKIWKWRSDPWFANIGTMQPQHKIQRLKQYIMDHFSFNLDLDTWDLQPRSRSSSALQHLLMSRFCRKVTRYLVTKETNTTSISTSANILASTITTRTLSPTGRQKPLMQWRHFSLKRGTPMELESVSL